MTPPLRARLLVNIGSSYANIGLTALITLLVIPIYVRTLGPAQWGTVALCMTLQGILFSIDVALSPIMLRDVARAAQQGRQHTVYLRFLRLYGGFAIGLFVLVQLVATWLTFPVAAGPAPLEAELGRAIRIVLFQFLFQFSNNAAIGYWNGLERQRFANLRLAGFALAKHGLALLAVTQWSASATAYLIPFAAIGLIEFLLNLARVRREDAIPAIPPAGSPPETHWREFAGYGLAAGLGVLTTLIDRAYLSLTLPAEQYGVYYLICTLTLSLLQLQVPIHRAYMPRMATADAPRPVLESMLKTSLLLLVLPCLAMALVPEWVLNLWLRNAEIAAAGAPALRLILIGVALIALYAPYSTLLLNQHRYRALSAINGAVLVVQLLLLVALTPSLGMTAGALAWLGCGLVQVGCAAVHWRAARNDRAARGEIRS